MRESIIESYLKKEVLKLGGKCLKYHNVAERGYPDRIIFIKGVAAFWVELKATGKQPSTLQKYRIKSLEALECKVFVIDSIEGVDNLITQVKNATS